MRRFALTLFFAVTLGSIGIAIRQYSALPQRVASHFNNAGQPDGWMSRDAHTLSQVGITLFIALLFFTLAMFLPRLPDRFINLPHRDYWLAPTRRGETFAWLSSALLWLGAALQIFLGWVFSEVARANLSAQPALKINSLWLQVSLAIIIMCLVITLLMRFRQPPPTGPRARTR